MSAYREALRVQLARDLRCARCAALNRPGATYIEVDETGTRAYCTICAAEGPVAAFQPHVFEASPHVPLSCRQCGQERRFHVPEKI